MSRRLEIIALFILVAAILAPRLPALDSFATVDEATWLMRSANFYYALAQRDFENTVYAYHPAVTTMWTGTAALIADFPAYRGLGQGYFEKEWKFSEFLEQQGYHPLQMLKASRLITVAINSLLLVAVYFLLRRLLGWFPAFVGTFILALEPFLLGHTRILAHEGMMSLLLLVSILSFTNYLWKGRQWLLLVLSGITAGLAILTKSSATIIIPFVGLLCLIELVRSLRKKNAEIGSTLWAQVKRFIGIGIIWLLALILVFVIFWPGMWVAPGKMIREMYGNAFSYALEGHNLESQDTTDLSAEPFQPTRFLKRAQDLLWRSTLITWLGLGLSIALIAIPKISLPARARPVMLTLFGFGLLFYLMMSIASGRSAAHYIMATHASWSLTSGLAIAFTISILRERLSGRPKFAIPVLATVGVLGLQAIFAFQFFPYYFNYSNPILEALQEGPQTPVTGFGEGLEIAAAYLAEKADAENLTVISWWGYGPFSFFFPGQTENLFPSAEWSPGLVTRLEKSDYLVVYYYHQVRRNMPVKLLREITGLEPEHTIWLKGIEYVRIFKVSDLPETLFIPDTIENP
jgi:hypothetical protein